MEKPLYKAFKYRTCSVFVFRIDPIDNQRGEFEYEDHGLRFSQVEVSQKLISMEDIEK